MFRPHFWKPSSWARAEQLLPQAGWLVVFNDETLIMLAQRRPEVSSLALSLLLHRRWKDLRNLVVRCASKNHLPAECVEDLQQDAIFWFVEAVEEFDLVQRGRTKVCHFRSFLWRVAIARIHNQIRQWKRERSRHQQAVPQNGIGSGTARFAPVGVAVAFPDGWQLSSLADDPARLAESREFQRILQAALSELDEPPPDSCASICSPVPPWPRPPAAWGSRTTRRSASGASPLRICVASWRAATSEGGHFLRLGSRGSRDR